MNKRVVIRLLVLSLVAVFSIYLIASRGLRLGLDLRGGVQVGLRVLTGDAGSTEAEKLMVQSMRVIQNRLDSMGVGEITLQRTGNVKDYEMQVQVPGVTDPDRVKKILQATAVLEWKLVERGPFESPQAATDAYSGNIPPNLEILRGPDSFYVVRREVAMSGRDLKDASLSRDPLGRARVAFALTAEGSQKFSTVTEQNIGRSLAIVLDGVIQSAPQINMRIAGDGVIEGGPKGFAAEQAQDLAVVLRSGALPAPTEYSSEQVVGPSLGADSIRAGMTASAVAMGAVAVFMVGYYRMAGINALGAMLLNLLILLGLMAAMEAPLTVPGIAGIVLTIGVGIDSNVLVFERIREELRLGKPASAAVAAGFQRVLRTLIDTHLAALISAAILFMMGTGAVRGFAVTLAIGLLSNLFTSVFASRAFFECGLRRGAKLSI